MRKCVIIFLLLIFPGIGMVFSQVEISVICADSWGPDRYNKVSYIMTLARSEGFVRFTQNFPAGFNIIPDKISGGDFSWTGKQLNIVWMKLPPGKEIQFSYYIQPGKSLSGNFDLTGKIIQVSGGVRKQTFPMRDVPVFIGGTNGILSANMQTTAHNENETNATATRNSLGESIKETVIFRIQVSSSSSKTPVEDIRKKLGIKTGVKLTVTKAGQVYKYQAGEFYDYESARKLLDQLQDEGLKDAFIVAYRGNEQILVEQALKDIGRNK